MKIRCENNSIRLRLRKSEIAQLRGGDSVRVEVKFSMGTTFSCELWIDGNTDEVRATGYGSHISVALPSEPALQWIDSEQVGIENFQTIDRDTTLHILVEKDFPCKDKPDSKYDDYFAELANQKTEFC